MNIYSRLACLECNSSCFIPIFSINRIVSVSRIIIRFCSNRFDIGWNDLLEDSSSNSEVLAPTEIIFFAHVAIVENSFDVNKIILIPIFFDFLATADIEVVSPELDPIINKSCLLVEGVFVSPIKKYQNRVALIWYRNFSL